MFLSCSGEQNEQFENPFEFLAQLEFEISLKNHANGNFSEKILKKHKSPNKDQKNLFLPNKKHFSLVHGGLRNFLRCGPGNFSKICVLTSPPTYNVYETINRATIVNGFFHVCVSLVVQDLIIKKHNYKDCF